MNIVRHKLNTNPSINNIEQGSVIKKNNHNIKVQFTAFTM